MPFCIAVKPTYEHLIKFDMPGKKGKRTNESFVAEFNYVDLEELDELRGKPHKEVMDRVLAGWSELVDETGEQVEFNAATKMALFKIPQAFEALVKGFWESIYGAKRKN